EMIRHQLGIERTVVICGPKEISLQVQSKLKGYTWNLINEGSVSYEVREIIDESTIEVYSIEPPLWDLVHVNTIKENQIFANNKFMVNFTILDHGIPSIAYRFKEYDTVKIDLQDSGFKGGKWVSELKEAFEKNNKEKKLTVEEKDYRAEELFHLLSKKIGDSFGVIMDHGANKENHEKIKNLFHGCDTVFIECFYNENDKEYAKLNLHSYSKESGKIMKEASVEKAIPVHFSRKYDEHERELLLMEFENSFKNLK
ncbi:MAG: peptidase, partial [bacterium]|nr:peptidase [bacterium]